MNKLIKFLVCVVGVLSFLKCDVLMASAEEANILKTDTVINVAVVAKDTFVKARYASAENRFLQGNVKAAYDDYSELISRATHDDYVFLVYAMKMAEYGFYDLAEELLLKLDNNLFTQNYIKDIKKFYYPSAMVNTKDTLYLADAYASIVYNNLAIEMTSELLNSAQASESDYKNYLISLGFYKSNNLELALKYINNAITQNDINVSYKILKAKILADSKKTSQALKVLKQIQNEEFLTVDFQEKVRAIEEYVMYKIAKEDSLRDYHLAYYYHLQNKSILATKVLQGAILQAKHHSSLIFGLLGHIYYENDEPLKAQEFAQRAYKEDRKNYFAALTLANLSYDERKFEEALVYYKEAKKIRRDAEPIVGIAKTYVALEKENKSKKMYEKMLKKNHNDSALLIGALSVYPQRIYEYLPTVVSLDITNNDIWLNLAHLAIREANFVMAETYLNNSYYIDGNNFKYYYYLSLVLKAKGEHEKAKQSLAKCLMLEADYMESVNVGLSVYGK